MSILRYFYQMIDKVETPSLEANLKAIEETHAQLCKSKGFASENAQGAPKAFAADDAEGESIDDVLQQDWDLLQKRSAPRSAHVSEEELQTLIEGGTLPRARQEHFSECKLCRDLVSRSNLTEDKIAKMSYQQATPPPRAESAVLQAVGGADFEVKPDPNRQLVPAGALAVAGACLLMLTVYMQPEESSHVEQRSSAKGMVTSDLRLQGELKEDADAFEKKVAILQELTAANSKVTLQGTAALEKHVVNKPFANSKATEVSFRPVFCSAKLGEDVRFYLDPDTSSQENTKQLTNRPFDAEVTGRVGIKIVDGKTELVIQVDDLQIHPPDLPAKHEDAVPTGNQGP